MKRVVAKDILKHRGLHVVEACDGLDAIEQTKLDRFDVIIMDLRMPRLNGFEATKIIRSQNSLNKHTPIVALTANAESSEIERCKKSGFSDFFSKPFDVGHLMKVIQKFINRQKNENIMSNEPINKSSILTESENQIMDKVSVEKLIMDTSLETIPVMFLVFVEELDKRAKNLKEAADNRDTDEVGEQAHALKSCTGTFGAMRLYKDSRALEDLARQQKIKFCELTNLVNNVLNVVGETRNIYLDYRKQIQKEINQIN